VTSLLYKVHPSYTYAITLTSEVESSMVDLKVSPEYLQEKTTLLLLVWLQDQFILLFLEDDFMVFKNRVPTEKHRKIVTVRDMDF
jgi:hypothetical protein